MSNVWPVPEAKARLSEVLRRARAGNPQIIGARDPCVVVSAEQFAAANRPKRHLGQWLIENAPTLGDIDLPARRDSRGDPFAVDDA